MGGATDEIALRFAAKDDIRRRLRALRRAVPPDARKARSNAAAQYVIALPAFSKARIVVAYWPITGETDPSAIVASARAAGKTIGLPRVEVGEELLSFHRFDEGDVLEESGRSFEQPLPSAPRLEEADIDLILVPAIAADERGYRIGFGAGFYDRILGRLPRATRVGLVFDFQLLAELPNTPGDEPLDFVVTDARLLCTDARGSL